MRRRIPWFLAGMLVALCTAATLTIYTLPSDDANFLSNLQSFLRGELGEHNYARFAGTVLYGGWHTDPGATLTATIPETCAFPDGYYTKEDSVSHTYSASSDTWVFIRADSSVAVTIGGAVISYDGTSSLYVFATMSNASTEPANVDGTLKMMKVVTDGSEITSVTDLRSGEVPVEGIMEIANQTLDTVIGGQAYIGNRVVTINERHTLAGNVTVPAGTTLRPRRGADVTVGTNTLTVNGEIWAGNYKWLTVVAGSTLDFNGRSPLNFAWVADADGTDVSTELQELINAAPAPGSAEFLVPYDSDGFGVGTALVLPDPGAGSGISSPELAWTFRGTGGRGKLLTTAAVNGIQSYDITVDEPGNWTRGLKFENLEIDCNGTGANGLRLHGVTRSEIENVYVHECTNAQLYFSRPVEVDVVDVTLFGDDSDPDNADYGIYTTDGTTLSIDESMIRYTLTGIHVDGNLTEAASNNNDGTDDVTVNHTVIESCGLHAIHVAAGDRFYAGPRTHIEDIGHNYAAAASIVKLSNEGGEVPANPVFDRVSGTTDAAGDDWIDLDRANRPQFIMCRDGGLRGGDIAANVSNAFIVAGGATNDWRPIDASNITNNSTSTQFLTIADAQLMVYANSSGGAGTDGDDNRWYLDAESVYPHLTRDATTRFTRVVKTSSGGSESTHPTILELVSGQMNIGPGATDEDVYLRVRVSVQTTDATVTSIWTLGLADETAYHIRAWVLGNKSDGSAFGSYGKVICVYRNGGGGATICDGGADDDWYNDNESVAGWDVELDVNGNNARLRVTGAAATTINWIGVVEYILVAGTA